MRWRLKLVRGFREFLSSDGKGARLGLIILIGIALIFVGSLGSGDDGEKQDSATEEERLSEMCSMMEGVGECRVMVSYGKDGEVYAVLVLCDGADLPSVRERIISSVTSLYGIGSNRVEIQTLNKK